MSKSLEHEKTNILKLFSFEFYAKQYSYYYTRDGNLLKGFLVFKVSYVYIVYIVSYSDISHVGYVKCDHQLNKLTQTRLKILNTLKIILRISIKFSIDNFESLFIT